MKVFRPRILYQHAEWTTHSSSTKGIFDFHFHWGVTASFSSPICLYREAMCLQCLPPTRYVTGGATLTTITEYFENCHLDAYCHCMAILCRYPHFATLSGQFFSTSCGGSLKKKQKKKKTASWIQKYNIISTQVYLSTWNDRPFDWHTVHMRMRVTLITSFLFLFLSVN